MIFFLYFFFLLYIEFFHRISSSPILLEHLSHHYTQQRAKKKTDSLLRSALRSRTPIDTTFLLPAAHRNGRATSSPSNLHSSCNKVASLLRIKPSASVRLIDPIDFLQPRFPLFILQGIIISPLHPFLLFFFSKRKIVEK